MKALENQMEKFFKLTNLVQALFVQMKGMCP